MALAEQIIDAIVETAVAGRPRIVICAIKGVSCEGWLKVELLWRLVGVLDPDLAEIRPERNNVDLVIQTPSEDILVELKAFPTNYGRAGKPITNFIGGVVEDLTKLATKRPAIGTGLAAWIAYPVPEPVPPMWQSHLARVEAAAATTLRAERIPLVEKTFANLYIMKSK